MVVIIKIYEKNSNNCEAAMQAKTIGITSLYSTLLSKLYGNPTVFAIMLVIPDFGGVRYNLTSHTYATIGRDYDALFICKTIVYSIINGWISEMDKFSDFVRTVPKVLRFIDILRKYLCVSAEDECMFNEIVKEYSA